jgi:hypothetical protein
MRCELSLMPCMALTAPCTALRLRVATSAVPVSSAMRAPCSANDAVLRTVPLICSIEAAVCSRLLAWASVREDRSWLPDAISAAAPRTLSTSLRTSAMAVRRFNPICDSASCSSPMRPCCGADRNWRRSPAASRSASPSSDCSAVSRRQRTRAQAPVASTMAVGTQTTGPASDAARPVPAAAARGAMPSSPQRPSAEISAPATRPTGSRRITLPAPAGRCAGAGRAPRPAFAHTTPGGLDLRHAEGAVRTDM